MSRNELAQGTYYKAVYWGETALAYSVRIQDEKVPRWIPKSAVLDITVDQKAGETIDIEIADGFAEKEGIL
jgi:hypothetical protein